MFFATFLLWTIFSSVLPQELSSNLKTLPKTEHSEIQYLAPSEFEIGRISVKPCPKTKIITNYLKQQGIPFTVTRDASGDPDVVDPDTKNLQDAKIEILVPPTDKTDEKDVIKEKPKDGKKQEPTDNRRSNNKPASIEVKENKLDTEPTPCDPSVTPNNCNEGYRAEYKTEEQEMEQKTLEFFEDCLKEKVDRILNDNGDTRRSLSPKGSDEESDEGSDESRSVELSPRYRDPASQAYASSIAQTKVSLIQNPRVCFACSTATNPTCWMPNRRTTVKYCNRNHNACVTKTYGSGASLTLIRDCANTCHDQIVPGLEPKYKSCNLCHSDLCNSAFSINSYNVFIILFVTLMKCTFY